MAKPGESVGSDRAELKRLLKMAADKPVPMAFAVGQDGKAIIKLDKIKPPRALEKVLKEDAAGSRNHRFGTVMLDSEMAGLVRFMINKPITGVARKLVVALKGTGFKKVTLVGEDGEALEEHEEEDTEGEAAHDEPATPAAQGEDATSRTAEAAPPAATQPAPDAQPGGDESARLTKQLGAAVKQMLVVIAKDPAQKSALAELATGVQASLKRGQFGEAEAELQVLQMAIASASGADTVSLTPPADAGPVPAADAAPPAAATGSATTRLRKSRVAWTATRAKVDDTLDKLSKAITAAGDGEDMGGDLEDKFYAVISPVLERLDGTLSDALDEAADATGDDRDAALRNVRATIGTYSRFVQGNPVIRQLDANPFMQTNLVKTITATLDTLSRSLG